jgi:hypothetical protein
MHSLELGNEVFEEKDSKDPVENKEPNKDQNAVESSNFKS